MSEAVTAPPGRSGRNLPMAIVVGCCLAAVVLLATVFRRELLIGVVAVASGVGMAELSRVVRRHSVRLPIVPLLAGALVMPMLAWLHGLQGLAFGLLSTGVVVAVWRLGAGVGNYGRDVAGAVLIAAYVPFLLSFGVLLVRPGDGTARVLVTLLAVVLSDTGGYAVGARFGKHPMAPTLSPKKTWEGFAGSALVAASGSALALHLALNIDVWQGALFGVVIAVAAVVGDLAESGLKRRLKIKDMSRLLPGHGGLMDRLDSVLLALPAAMLLLTVVIPGE